MDKLSQMPSNYEEFLLQNRKYINSCMIDIITLCIFTGPAIALGIFFGVFTHTSYIACINISIAMLILLGVCQCLYNRFPYSTYSSVTAIVAMNVLLVYMTYSKIDVSVTWFLMPLLSMLLLDLKIYTAICGLNYLMIILSIWLTYDSNMDFFKDVCGRTIESIIMGIVGFEIGRLIAFYYKSMINDKATIISNQAEMQKQYTLLESMADMYDKVNFIDFENMTEESLQDDERTTYELNLDVSSHSHMVENLLPKISGDYIKRFTGFTDLHTIKRRLTNKKIIYLEFTNIQNEWYRAQYITASADENGVPSKVIFTIQNIDEEKKKEDRLLQIALTDELTRLFNRRSFEEDVAELEKHPLSASFGILSVDVNGLKIANDTKGHMAGDELINGAAKCLVAAVGNYGKVYRTGGDEFIAILFTNDFPSLEKSIVENMKNWSGKYIHDIKFSIGYASIADYPEATIKDLQELADKKMYLNKELYYREKGIDRQALYDEMNKHMADAKKRFSVIIH